MAADEPLGAPFEPGFQRRFIEARDLDASQVEAAVRHGLEAQPRFADRPFEEVEEYLRESWQGMGPPAPWDQVWDLVRGGYEWQRAAGVNRTIELGEDAARRFVQRTVGGSGKGGVLGDSPAAGPGRQASGE
ncbi:MAG TPA: hypothetical protein VNZ57_06495 [Longimicrobiales bacterium]|nr:hypothetical protein [Longimicrobiales bacterium]